MKTTLPQIAIVGRANVGKSTLFNRLVEKNKALVSAISGTTRDRNIDKVSWQGKEFIVIDTGGLDIERKQTGKIEINIVKQAHKAIDDADLILFLIDIKAGVLSTDKELAREIIKSGKKNKTILVGNKADSIKYHQMAGDLYALNLGEPHMISAANGSGCGDLLDMLTGILPKRKAKIRPDRKKAEIKVAIVGKPNVGKSSILNSILGEERVIVTDIAHTTRESQDIGFSYKENDFILIDTAGIVRKSKIGHKTLERKSIDKSLHTIDQADVVVFVTEAQKKIDSLDKKVTQEILDSGKSLIIVANKWDLIPEKDTNTINQYVDYYYNQFPYLWWAPIIFVSAKDEVRTRKILDMILDIQKSKQIQISNSQLDKFLKYQVSRHRPSRGRGLKNPYIYKIEQVSTNPPRFMVYVNDPKILHFSYLRFLQNNIRQKFNILGTPIQIETKKWNVLIEAKENKKYGNEEGIAKQRSRELAQRKNKKHESHSRPR
ncbi:MAG: ribosome biogenesis GTPase Der [Candidatus Buchananbacteria bacterium]|nr:ribosome biogenesis GTPase Der [Candidatus Buchananbacteria bacterium]